MTRQLLFAVDGLTDNFLERCWVSLLKTAGSCGWLDLRGVTGVRRHTNSPFLCAGQIRFGWSLGEKQLVWVGELIRFAW